MRTALLLPLCLAVATTLLAQTPPPPDLDALAREAEEFKRGRQVGAAVIWGGLLVASVIIGWVRIKARRERAK